MAQPKSFRIGEFLRRVERAASPPSAAAALQLLNDVMKDVEDEMSDVPYDPSEPGNDGRMYGPSPRDFRPVPGKPDVIRYPHTNHNTFIRENGAIKITMRKPPTVILDKAGIDGKKVDDA